MEYFKFEVSIRVSLNPFLRTHSSSITRYGIREKRKQKERELNPISLSYTVFSFEIKRVALNLVGLARIEEEKSGNAIGGR